MSTANLHACVVFFLNLLSFNSANLINFSFLPPTKQKMCRNSGPEKWGNGEVVGAMVA
jgi:hypothetical protein